MPRSLSSAAVLVHFWIDPLDHEAYHLFFFAFHHYPWTWLSSLETFGFIVLVMSSGFCSVGEMQTQLLFLDCVVIESKQQIGCLIQHFSFLTSESVSIWMSPCCQRILHVRRKQGEAAVLLQAGLCGLVSASQGPLS